MIAACLAYSALAALWFGLAALLAERAVVRDLGVVADRYMELDHRQRFPDLGLRFANPEKL